MRAFLDLLLKDLRAHETVLTNREMWNAQLKGSLEAVCREVYPGMQLEFRYRGSGGEFLLDFGCFSKTNFLVAGEIELSDNWKHVIDDFEKLVYIHSPLKILCYQCGSSEVERYFREYLASFALHSPLETFLLLKFDLQLKTIVSARTFRAAREGPIDESGVIFPTIPPD